MKKAKLDREGMEFAHEYSQPTEIKNIAKQVEKKTQEKKQETKQESKKESLIQDVDTKKN